MSPHNRMQLLRIDAEDRSLFDFEAEYLEDKYFKFIIDRWINQSQDRIKRNREEKLHINKSMAHLTDGEKRKLAVEVQLSLSLIIE